MDVFLFFIGFFAGAGVTGICVGAYLDHSEFKKEERKQYCLSQFEGFRKMAIFEAEARLKMGKGPKLTTDEFMEKEDIKKAYWLAFLNTSKIADINNFNY